MSITTQPKETPNFSVLEKGPGNQKKGSSKEEKFDGGFKGENM